MQDPAVDEAVHPGVLIRRGEVQQVAGAVVVLQRECQVGCGERTLAAEQALERAAGLESTQPGAAYVGRVLASPSGPLRAGRSVPPKPVRRRATRAPLFRTGGCP